MYRCEITKRVSRPGEPLHKVTAVTRPRIYTRWVKNEETMRWEEVEAGRGTEIVRELSLSLDGVQQWNSMTPEDKAIFLKHQS